MPKYNFKNKFSFLLKLIVIYFLIFLKTYAGEQTTSGIFVALGQRDAPVKIKIFSSLTCPHCANFHTKVVSKLKDKYVNSGKVQLMFYDFPLDQAAFNASKLLHCLEHKNQILYLDQIYEKQNEWTNGSNIDDINNNLKQIVKVLGINSAQFEKCVNDEAVSDKILNSRINGHKKYSINSTPTIIINEKKLEGSVNFKDIKKKIEKLI